MTIFEEHGAKFGMARITALTGIDRRGFLKRAALTKELLNSENSLEFGTAVAKIAKLVFEKAGCQRHLAYHLFDKLANVKSASDWDNSFSPLFIEPVLRALGQQRFADKGLTKSAINYGGHAAPVAPMPSMPTASVAPSSIPTSAASGHINWGASVPGFIGHAPDANMASNVNAARDVVSRAVANTGTPINTAPVAPAPVAPALAAVAQYDSQKEMAAREAHYNRQVSDLQGYTPSQEVLANRIRINSAHPMGWAGRNIDPETQMYIGPTTQEIGDNALRDRAFNADHPSFWRSTHFGQAPTTENLGFFGRLKQLLMGKQAGINKQGTAGSMLAGIPGTLVNSAEISSDMLGKLYAAAGFGGVGLGALNWNFNRHVQQDDAALDPLKAKRKYYQLLAHRINNELTADQLAQGAGQQSR